jgi:hypothetical protein
MQLILNVYGYLVFPDKTAGTLRYCLLNYLIRLPVNKQVGR